MSAWTGYADESSQRKYLNNARALLGIRCCGIASYFDMEKTWDGGLMAEPPRDLSPQFQDALARYVSFEMSAQDCVSKLVQLVPESARTAHNLMPLVCSTADLCEDPERRATLQLTILNRMPKTFTPCCGNRICFRCKTYGWHDGTCEEVQRREMGQRVCFCPSCGVPTIKSEGCDHMICVCGENWTWGVNPLLKILRSCQKGMIESGLRQLEDINAVLEGSDLTPIDFFLEECLVEHSDDTLSILKLFANLGAVASPRSHSWALWEAAFGRSNLSLVKLLLDQFHKVSSGAITEVLTELVERLCIKEADRLQRSSMLQRSTLFNRELGPDEKRSTMLNMSMLLIDYGADLHEASLSYSSLSKARRAGCPPELLRKLCFVNVAADSTDILDERLIRDEELAIAQLRKQRHTSRLEIKQASSLKTSSRRPRGGKRKVSDFTSWREDLCDHF